MSAASQPQSFAAQVARLHSALTGDGLQLADMRRAQSLELHLAGRSDLVARPVTRPAGIEPIEGPIEARLVPRLPDGASRLRYFLDGAQRTFLVWRCGLVPIVATISAAAILDRDSVGGCLVVPGTLRLEHAWMIPRRLDHPTLAQIERRVAESGGRVVDPLGHLDDDDQYRLIAGDYGRLVEAAHNHAGKLREALEIGLLQQWADAAERENDDGWIVTDGRLRSPVARAVGLVKEITETYLTGPEAETLLGLRPGQRTTAFVPADRRRDGAAPQNWTLWYLRLWDAVGLDARHALVRVEAGSDVRTSGQIDQISAWLIRERTPRATADARWATLLYPIHFLERILKRQLEADTRGWPGG